MVKVKICGITNLEDALCACQAQADALGFVFYKKSPRFIQPNKAKDIIMHLPKKILKIGVFVNENKEKIKKIVRQCGLNMIQLHGNESPDFCAKLKNYKVIKAFRIRDKDSLKKISQYNVYALLFDAYSPTKYGGTSKKFNWSLLKSLQAIKKSVFLSGGLSSKNVVAAIKMAKPDWVDASSSLESAPGKKSHRKTRRFIAAAKKAPLP